MCFVQRCGSHYTYPRMLQLKAARPSLRDTALSCQRLARTLVAGLDLVYTAYVPQTFIISLQDDVGDDVDNLCVADVAVQFYPQLEHHVQVHSLCALAVTYFPTGVETVRISVYHYEEAAFVHCWAQKVALSTACTQRVFPVNMRFTAAAAFSNTLHQLVVIGGAAPRSGALSVSVYAVSADLSSVLQHQFTEPVHFWLGMEMVISSADTLLITERDKNRVHEVSLLGEDLGSIACSGSCFPHSIAASGNLLVMTSILPGLDAITACHPSKLVLMKYSTKSVMWTVNLPQYAPPTGVKFSPDGATIYVGTYNAKGLCVVMYGSVHGCAQRSVILGPVCGGFSAIFLVDSYNLYILQKQLPLSVPNSSRLFSLFSVFSVYSLPFFSLIRVQAASEDLCCLARAGADTFIV